ncbi:MAG: alkaline phosphatase [Elusimicrobia bacterium RIFOXYA2_FULL_50_26]|nr:MAG: alkaline phosphatase [Elusimicrobia bacterium RIFOXYA2_FULL_50_26]OGS25353.1 MAG: alkaline phosphatase [Elusimicrobia bacterium RIFOXYB2_FULL_50_12]
MIEQILGVLSQFVISTINSMGYAGIALLMAIESACIPLPSEVILPFSGYLVAQGVFNIHLVALAGAIGCVLGSIVAYYAGAWGGRAWIMKYGKYVLISRHDMDMADRWFERHGEITVFVARLLPVIRTFIALPAGIAKMRMSTFIIYTFVGSYIWSWALAWVGYRMGQNWASIRVYFHKFDFAIGAVMVVGATWYIWRHIKAVRSENGDSQVG